MQPPPCAGSVPLASTSERPIRKAAAPHCSDMVLEEEESESSYNGEDNEEPEEATTDEGEEEEEEELWGRMRPIKLIP